MTGETGPCTCEAFVPLLDLDGHTSWAEYELKAAVYGVPVDGQFCRYMLALTQLWSPAARMVAEGILSSPAWNVFKNSAGLVSDVCELYGPSMRKVSTQPAEYGIRRMADKLSRATVTTGNIVAGDVGRPDYLMHKTRKYLLLDAIERRFPLLPVKYYAENAKLIHGCDEELAIWIKQRLSSRSKESETFRKIYESMSAEFVNNHLNAAVFMK